MSAPWLPAFLPGASRSGALWNALVSYAGHPLPLGVRGASAAFTLAEPPAPGTRCVVVEPARAPRLHVLWTSFPFRPVMGVELSVADLPALPPALGEALAEGMVALVWSAVPDLPRGFAHAPGEVRLGAVPDRAEADLTWFSLVLRGLAEEPITLLVGCHGAALLDALADGLAVPRRVRDGLETQFTAEAWVTLGALALSLGEMAALVPGAVVVLPAPAADLLTLHVEDRLYRFRPSAGGWECLGHDLRRPERADPLPGDSAMTSPQGEGLATASVRLASLPLVIDFDLGRLTVPLSEVATWQPGSVVALDPPREGVEVTLRANGRAIGTGDLVRIDDRVAVRISRLFLQP